MRLPPPLPCFSDVARSLPMTSQLPAPLPNPRNAPPRPPAHAHPAASLWPPIWAAAAHLSPRRWPRAPRRKLAQKYYRVYNEDMPLSQLSREVAGVMQEFTQQGGVRPFGVSLLAAGYDDEGPHLYQIDPSGSYWAWKASAIGNSFVSAKTFLEKRYNEEVRGD